jgi:membrane protease YdiL (CAAX protease family)
MSTRDLLKFVALAFGLGWFFQAFAIRSGVNGNGGPWLIATMWAPLLAAVLTGPDARRRLWALVKRSGWKLWPVALAAGWSFSTGQQLLLSAGRKGHWNAEVFRLRPDHSAIASIHRVAMLFGVGSQGFGLFALNLALTISVAALVTMLIGGIGEESGWRGILQPELARRFGVFRGTLLVGLIWGFWHLPANLAGYNDTHRPVLTALIIFPIHTVAISFGLAWLTRTTASVWPAALAHAANNVLQSGPLIVPNGWLADQITALSASLIAGTVFAWLLIRASPAQSRTPAVVDVRVFSS